MEPSGRFDGRDAILDRITGFTERFPGATVAITTQVDEHNAYARYAWTIVAHDGAPLLQGMDVVERASDGRLRNVLMFFGELQPR